MDAKAYAARNRAGSDWFGHSEDKVSPSEENKAPPQQNTEAPGEQVAKTALIKPVCNSNQWFRHEGSKAEAAKDAVDHHGSQHAHGDHHHHHHHHEARANGEAKVVPVVEEKGANAPMNNQASKEGEANCQRDKASSDWFSHQDPSKPIANPRAGSAESSSNALKMRNESENWFSHDPKAPSEPLHPSKGGTSKSRGNQEMYNIFHHGQ